MGPIGSKVIEVKGQICLFLFVPSNWVKGHRGQRSNLFIFVCSSQVLGSIFTKLGGKVEGGPGYHRGQRSNLCCFFFCLFLPGPWADLHKTRKEG